MGKRILAYFLLLAVFIPVQMAAQNGMIAGRGIVVENGDTLTIYTLRPVYVFNNKRGMRGYEKLVYNVKKVYPYAKEAGEYLDMMEKELLTIRTQREKEKFIKKVEKEIVKKYTPILKTMTYSQGKILIKLVDRETKKTAHTLLKDFRGGIAAGFWNMIAKFFNADLKTEYDMDGEDAMIEQIIQLYEAGMI